MNNMDNNNNDNIKTYLKIYNPMIINKKHNEKLLNLMNYLIKLDNLNDLNQEYKNENSINQN